MVMVRSDPVPPNWILLFETSVVTLDVAVTVRLDAGVSASPILKGIALVGVFSATV